MYKIPLSFYVKRLSLVTEKRDLSSDNNLTGERGV